jgi:type I restriction enzyme, S subunit
MSFPKYEVYKDSGVEWLGEVPEHWDVTLLKRGYQVVLGKMLQPEQKRDQDEYLLYLRAGNIQPTGIDTSDIKRMWFSPDEKDSLRLKKGDLLISEGGDVGRSVIWDVDGEFYFQNSINRVRSIKDNSTQFLHYWMIAVKNKGYIDVLCNKSTIAHFTVEKVATVPIPLPTKKEQTQIARFLDRETTRIDALIAEQQRLIELLKEKRQAVISHAVTKGINRTVPMKDSGVEWLGEVPEHWIKKRLKNVSPFIAVGIVVNPSSYISEEGLPFLYGGEVKEGYIEVEKARKISPEDSKKNQKTMLEAGDIVTMRVGYPGLTAVVPPECEGGNCASVMFVKRGDYDSHWLCALMNSRLIRQQVEMVQYGAAQKQFNISDAVEFWLYEPPKIEQTKIADFIKSKSSVFDALISEAENSKSLLSERRSALISAAVTGKIDVRNWQPSSST